jgi:hypothetical protein
MGILHNSLTRKTVEAIKQKEEVRKKLLPSVYRYKYDLTLLAPFFKYFHYYYYYYPKCRYPYVQ